jgi:hypothetical protein
MAAGGLRLESGAFLIEYGFLSVVCHDIYLDRYKPSTYCVSRTGNGKLCRKMRYRVIVVERCRWQSDFIATRNDPLSARSEVQLRAIAIVRLPGRRDK